MSPFILNLDTKCRWVVSLTPRSLYPHSKLPRWMNPTASPDAAGAEKYRLPPSGIESQIVHTLEWSLYQLGYFEHNKSHITSTMRNRQPAQVFKIWKNAPSPTSWIYETDSHLKCSKFETLPAHPTPPPPPNYDTASQLKCSKSEGVTPSPFQNLWDWQPTQVFEIWRMPPPPSPAPQKIMQFRIIFFKPYKFYFYSNPEKLLVVVIQFEVWRFFNLCPI